MTVAEFLTDLRKRDVALWLDGDRLRCSAPPNVLTAELQAELARRKPEILASLRAAQRRPGGPPPLSPVARTGPMPLSFGQQRLWFLHQMDPNSAVYTIHDTMVLDAVDVPLLNRALTEMVRRHETLRTTFQVIDGDPAQVIAPPGPVAVKYVDLRDVEAEAKIAELKRLKTEIASAPFDLSKGPLFRLVAAQLSESSFELNIAQHHIVTDGWSLALFYSEVAAIYAAYAADKPHGLPDLKVQYADYAYWQRRWFLGDVLAPQLAYWKQKLAGATVLDVPTDHPRPAMQTFKGALQVLALSKHLSDGAVALSRARGVTIYMVLLAAFKVLLAKYSGQTDLTTGTSNGNRTRTELEQIIGFFVNTQVLRVDLSGDPTLAEVLKRVSATALEALANQDVPFEKLVEELQTKRDLSRSPFFDVMFILQNTKLETLSKGATPNRAKDLAARQHGGGTTGFATRIMSEGAGTRVVIETGISKFDLTLYLMETNEGIRGSLEYNTDLFEHSTITRMLDHYELILGAFVENADQRMSDVTLQTLVEHDRLKSWQGPVVAPSPAQTVAAAIAAQAARTPDAVAVGDGTTTLSYEVLETQSTALAQRLRAAGVDRGALVGVCVERSAAMVVALLAVWKAGAAYVPLDPAFPPDRLAYMLADANVRAVIQDAASAASVPPHTAAVVLLDEAATAPLPTAPALPAQAGGEDVAYVIYTSGSTGRPKGVAVPHRAVLNFLASMATTPGLTARDVMVAVTTLSFDIAGLELWLPLTVGARVEIASRTEAADGRLLQARLASAGATVLQATPATWRLLLEAGWTGGPELRMLCGGEALPPDLAAQVLAGGGELWNLYGPTETTIWSTVEAVAPDAPVTIGRPIANTQAYVRDAAGQSVPVGVLGELYLGGTGLAHGYLGQPALTAERFVPDPLSGVPGARLYRTGDVARWRADGRLQCLGRVDHQVKVRGFRIELGEIETALAAHPAIKAAVVTAQPDATGTARLVAYFVADRDVPTTSDLRRFLRTTLPDYMVPSFFMGLDALPLTQNNKVDRRALPRTFGAPEAGAAYLAPRTPTEQRIAAVWQEVLGIERVSIDANFFDVGGHSLLAMKVIGRIEAALGLRLNPRVLMLDTLEQIAAGCDRRHDAAAGTGPRNVQPLASTA